MCNELYINTFFIMPVYIYILKVCGHDTDIAKCGYYQQSSEPILDCRLLHNANLIPPQGGSGAELKGAGSSEVGQFGAYQGEGHIVVWW